MVSCYIGCMRLLKQLLLFLVGLLGMLLVYDSFLPPISTLMIARVVSLQPVARTYVPLEKISPHLPRAVIAAEDGKFCQHAGVDWKAFGKVVEDYSEDGSAKRGASTISMQVTKNLFLWNGRSVLRKGLELPMAVGLDAIWSKRQMMEAYLNVAEFGPGIFGVEAASRNYFRKSARALSAREAALLAATLPNPLKRNPARPSRYVASYANSIAGRAWQQDVGCLSK